LPEIQYRGTELKFTIMPLWFRLRRVGITITITITNTITITITITNYEHEYDYDHEYEHDQAAGRREVPRAAASGARGQPPRCPDAATPFHHGGGCACHASWWVIADPAATGCPLTPDRH